MIRISGGGGGVVARAVAVMVAATMVAATIELERVVEELKEEIWELDTNNRFLQHIVIIIFLDDFWYFSHNYLVLSGRWI
mgnify:CR=1 FL=1